MLAQGAMTGGKYIEARDYYEELLQLCRSLLRQSEEYVRQFVAQEKLMESKLGLASEERNRGRYIEARGLWQDVVDIAMMKPVVFEYK